jgi:hypothetical protein
LTEIGWSRAHRLVDLVDPAQAPRPGLARPKAIYAAAANNNGEGTRTRETIAPLADKLGISWQHGGQPGRQGKPAGQTSPSPPTSNMQVKDQA